MLTFELQQREALEVSFAVSIVAGKEDPYTGAYKVTPKIYGPVVLETKDKSMADDVTVLKIPQFEVSNEAGGNTLIMGDEYYGG
jgi:hypothetical protein|nr:MAG TPA: hypothetical protein [Caudoviricetes sp.]